MTYVGIYFELEITKNIYVLVMSNKKYSDFCEKWFIKPKIFVVNIFQRINYTLHISILRAYNCFGAYVRMYIGLEITKRNYLDQ